MKFFSYEKIGLWTTLNTFIIVILPLILGHRTRFSASIRTLDIMTRNRLFNLFKTQVEDWYSEVLGDPNIWEKATNVFWQKSPLSYLHVKNHLSLLSAYLSHFETLKLSLHWI